MGDTPMHKEPAEWVDPSFWLPSQVPVSFLQEWKKGGAPAAELLLKAYRGMVVGRRFDQQATALARQGRLAVHPSSLGQEACQVGAALALRATDWLFPTYRDCVALISRGIDPVETLTLLRGDAHCGYDPARHRTAPQCTPLATHAAHAVGLAHGERLKGADTVALALVGDGATSEGDFHEAVNLAGVLHAPVVFLIQNNRYAISVPLSAQSAAPAAGVQGDRLRRPRGAGGRQRRSRRPLGADRRRGGRARRSSRPWLIEAHTYRVGPHTSADDPSRYRTAAEEEHWRARDPLTRLEAALRDRGLLSDADVTTVAEEAEAYAAGVRERLAAAPESDPTTLLDHVFASPTPQLLAQREALHIELERR